MTKKYIVYPGHVVSQSQNDGDRHYISAGQLMHLHKVNVSECIIIWNEHDHYKLRGIKRNLIKLYPRYDGKYKSYNKPLDSDGKKPLQVS